MSPPTESNARDPRARRTVFLVSDGTGVTVETLGHSLLSQFESLEFRYVIIPEEEQFQGEIPRCFCQSFGVIFNINSAKF